MGVSVGLLVGELVGVLVGVGPLSELTTSPAEPPSLFHVARSCELPADERCDDTDFGELAELTVVGLDHDEYGLAASVYFIAPLSKNQETRFDVAEYSPAPRDVASPVNTSVDELHVAGEPE